MKKNNTPSSLAALALMELGGTNFSPQAAIDRIFISEETKEAFLSTRKSFSGKDLWRRKFRIGLTEEQVAFVMKEIQE